MKAVQPTNGMFSGFAMFLNYLLRVRLLFFLSPSHKGATFINKAINLYNQTWLINSEFIIFYEFTEYPSDKQVEYR